MRVSRSVFYCALFLSSLLVLRIAGSVTVGDVLMVASAVTLTVAIVKPKIQHPAGKAVAVGGSLLVWGGLLSTAASTSPLDSLLVLMRAGYVVLVLPWQTLKLLDTSLRLSRGLNAFSAGAALCGFGTLFQMALGKDVIPGASVTNAGRFSGFTEHVSDVGGISALAVVLGLSQYRMAVRMRSHLAASVVTIGGIVGLVLSGSVSGMLSALFGSVLLFWLVRTSWQKIAMILAAPIPAWLISARSLSNVHYALGPIERFYQTFGLAGRTSDLGTVSTRLETDQLGLTRFSQRPLTGVGLDWASSPVLGELGVHNLWVAALYRGGIVFALGMTLVIVAVLLAGWRRRHASTLIASTLAFAVTALCFAATAPSFFNRYFWAPIAFLYAAAAVGHCERHVNHKPLT